MRWIKSLKSKNVLFADLDRLKLAGEPLSICLPCSPCLVTPEARGGRDGLDSICCWSPAMASRDGILETIPGPALGSSIILPWGVLGGVGGCWWEGGRVPCRAAESIPGPG